MDITREEIEDGLKELIAFGLVKEVSPGIFKLTELGALAAERLGE
jgi:predicted transcriptional regulator